MPTNEDVIDGLREERKGYVLRGLDDRVAQVDAAIKAAGGTPPKAPAKKASK